MDARRFDLLARGVARFGSRRSFLRSFAIAAGGSVAGSRSALALDATSAGIGGTSGGTAVCPPSRRPTKQVSAVPPFPVFIVGGACADLDESKSYNLIDAGVAESGKRQGAKSAIAAASSMTSIRVALDDLLAKPYAVVVRAGSSSNELIACGEIGGVLSGKSVSVGLREWNGSGFAGVASLTGDGAQTTVNVFTAQDLFELVDAWEGTTVIATDDINLRDKPSEDAKVIAVLGAGSMLNVTGPANGNWLPVTNEATGDKGYVNADYVELQG